MIDEQRKISAALAQRRHLELHDVEPIEQVLAKTPPRTSPGRSRLVLAMMRTSTGAGRVPPTGHTSRSSITRRSLTWSGRGAHRSRREERASIGRDEQARIRLYGRCERAAHMPEELALEQGLGDRPAVDRDEGPVTAGAGRVHRARDQLLADPALPRDQHGARGAGAPGDLLAKGAHRVGLADEGLRDRPRLMRVPRAQALSPAGLPLLEHALHARAQVVDAERLLEIVPCAVPKGGDGGLEARVGRHENDRRARIEHPRALQHREAPDTRHDDVGEDDVEFLRGDPRDRLLAAARRRHLIPLGRQGRGQHLLHGNNVVDHENRRCHGLQGPRWSQAGREPR